MLEMVAFPRPSTGVNEFHKAIDKSKSGQWNWHGMRDGPGGLASSLMSYSTPDQLHSSIGRWCND